ncbi:MAG: PfkB family carbohydrate kinase, partial [Bryocella sp.]
MGWLEGGFARLKVLVVGDLMLDRYIFGEVDRISPEAPVPVLRHAQRYERPGGAANVAMNLVGLGCKTVLAGFWGQDSERDQLAGFLGKADVDVAGVVTTTRPTVSKTRIIARQQQLLRLDIESRDRPSNEEFRFLKERVEQLVGKVHAVVLSDYAKGALSRDLCETVIREARTQRIPVLVDPKSRDFSMYSGATVLCPNLKELSEATGVPAHQMDELIAAGQEQRREHDFEHLAVTMSEKGIRVLSEENSFYSPAQAREVFDVSG